MFVKCPFYGFRWPPGRPELIEVGGNECGLELDTRQACRMESDGRAVNYNFCPVALRWKPILDVALHDIRFRPADRVDATSWTTGFEKS